MHDGRRHTDVAILQPAYLPWLGYFDQVATADVFVLYDDVQFDKGGWRNRNRILASRGHQWLTVPVKRHLTTRIREVEIDGDRWVKKHLATIRQIYGQAPHFEWCYDAVQRYLTAGPYTMLLDLCLAGHRALCALLQIDTPVRLSSEFGHEAAGRTGRLVRICADLDATRYVSGDAARDYMDETEWARAGIELVYQDYTHPVYDQFTKPFVSHLSVIDALMFAGPRTREFVAISVEKQGAG